ncbi:MAG: hypothetical protein ACKO1F_13370, partial [Flammeovirgaceae bacterium]
FTEYAYGKSARNEGFGSLYMLLPTQAHLFLTTDFGLLIGNASKNKVKGGGVAWSVLTNQNIFMQSNGIGHLTDTLALPSW